VLDEGEVELVGLFHDVLEGVVQVLQFVDLFLLGLLGGHGNGWVGGGMMEFIYNKN
jgi:hypothetical protein